jgi:thiamine-phosphate diphosphorylase
MPLDGPVVCLVTDRRQLPDQSSFGAVRRQLLDVIREAAAAGVDLVQVRENDLETVQLVDLVGAVVAVARGGSTRVVVNDRVDVALTCGADGVHLRADSFTPRAVRAMVPESFLVGRSVHDLDEAREHGAHADYLVAGTVFPTISKPTATRWLGADGLHAIVQAVRVPVLAIGGVGPERVEEVARTGAAGFAAIRLFLARDGSLAETIQSVHRRFDSARAAF